MPLDRVVLAAWAPEGRDFCDLLGQPDAYQRIAAIIDAATAPVAPDLAMKPVRERTDRRKIETGEKSSPAETQGRAKSVSRPAEDGGDDKPRALGFSVETMNEKYALVLMGGKPVVFEEEENALVEDQKRIVRLEGFHTWFKNCFTEVVGAGGKIKRVTWAEAWLQSRDRRSYRGIEFHPNPDGVPGTPGYLNLYSGFAVEPSKNSTPTAYKTFRDHLLNNVCAGERALFDWVFGFFAHTVQLPRERLGVALVMRGRMGAGKSKAGEVIGSLFPRHFFQVDQARYVTGNFNAHMASCLILQADEAVWAGDKAAEGRLKGMITSEVQLIEPKGIDPIRVKNYVRLIMTSNEDWVVPAGPDERRFCVLDVDPRCLQNFDYFREMDEELNNGGREALLHDLLAFDLSAVNLRQIPYTEALLEQKVRSLNSVASWWLERLIAGATLSHGSLWNTQVPCTSLHNDYIKVAEHTGIKRKQEENSFGMTLRKFVPNIDRRKRTVDVADDHGHFSQKRTWCYLLPSLDEARAAFETFMNQPVDWPSDEPEPPSPAPAEAEDVRM